MNEVVEVGKQEGRGCGCGQGVPSLAHAVPGVRVYPDHTTDGQEAVPPTQRLLASLQLRQVDFRHPHADVVFEAPLALPHHHEQRAAEGVAGGVAECLVIFGLSGVARDPGLTLVYAAITVLQIGLHVGVCW